MGWDGGGGEGGEVAAHMAYSGGGGRRDAWRAAGWRKTRWRPVAFLSFFFSICLIGAGSTTGTNNFENRYRPICAGWETGTYSPFPTYEIFCGSDMHLFRHYFFSNQY